MTEEWDPDDEGFPMDCDCQDPDPDDNDEPWVPVVCGNCGGRL